MQALYVVLIASTSLVVGVAIGMWIRVKKLSQASQTQFLRAVKEQQPETVAPESKPPQVEFES